MVARALRLGTRGSQLALTQSQAVADWVARAHGVKVELEVIRTKGDQVVDRPLPEIGGKGLFTEALDQALLDERIDLAVHSLKDLPTAGVEGLQIACIPEREDPRDVLVAPAGRSVTLQSLVPGAVVGTSSLRRRALLAAFRPELSGASVRGNLDTRLRKLDEGQYDALVLAAAGLRRLGLAQRISEWLERTSWLPAPGQGALAVVTRSDDVVLQRLLGTLHHAASASAVTAERSLLRRLEGGCQIPVGALGIPFQGGLRLWGLVVSADGRHAVRADVTGAPAEAERLGERVAELLLVKGAAQILEEHANAHPAPSPP